jgi:hypothetical protein
MSTPASVKILFGSIPSDFNLIALSLNTFVNLLMSFLLIIAGNYTKENRTSLFGVCSLLGTDQSFAKIPFKIYLFLRNLGEADLTFLLNLIASNQLNQIPAVM